MPETPNSNHERQPLRDPPAPPSNTPPRFLFESLARGAREIHINYNEQIYRLRVTKNGKLILNK